MAHTWLLSWIARCPTSRSGVFYTVNTSRTRNFPSTATTNVSTSRIYSWTVPTCSDWLQYTVVLPLDARLAQTSTQFAMRQLLSSRKRKRAPCYTVHRVYAFAIMDLPIPANVFLVLFCMVFWYFTLNNISWHRWLFRRADSQLHISCLFLQLTCHYFGQPHHRRSPQFSSVHHLPPTSEQWQVQSSACH